MHDSKFHVFRIKPDQEVIAGILDYCQQNKITSAIIAGIIGSANSAKLNFLQKMPGKYNTHELRGPLEIIAAQGTVAVKEGQTLMHIHAQLANENACYGGHLVEAKVFSTAEVMLQTLDF